MGALVPFNRHLIDRIFRTPPCIGDDGDCRIIDFDDLFDAFHGGNFCGVVTFQFPIEIGADFHRSHHHAGHCVVDGINLTAIELGFGVKPRQGFARDGPILGIF